MCMSDDDYPFPIDREERETSRLLTFSQGIPFSSVTKTTEEHIAFLRFENRGCTLKKARKPSKTNSHQPRMQTRMKEITNEIFKQKECGNKEELLNAIIQLRKLISNENSVDPDDLMKTGVSEPLFSLLSTEADSRFQAEILLCLLNIAATNNTKFIPLITYSEIVPVAISLLDSPKGIVVSHSLLLLANLSADNIDFSHFLATDKLLTKMFNLLKTSLKIASSLPPPFSDPSQEIVQLENDFPIKQARKLAKSDAERDHKMDTVESKAEYESDDDDYDDDDEEEDEEEEEEEEEESNQHIFGGEGTEEGSSSHFVKLHSSHIVDQIIGPLILLFSNLCRTPTSKELFKPFVPVLVQLVCSKCWPLIVDSLISLARLVEAGNGYTQDMCHKPLFETLIGLLKMKDRVYQSSAVIFLSAVMYADAPELSELALNSGSIPTVVALLDDDRLALLSETLSIITNSVLSEECRREALAAGVAQKLSHILRKSQTLAIKKETVLCVHNIACGSAFCVSSLVEASVHVELIRMLNCPDEDTVKKCLKILFRSLRFGEKIAKEVERIVESNSEDEGIDDETITDGTAGKMEVEADEMAEAKKSLSLLADLRNDNTSSSPSSDIYRILKHYNFNIVLQSLDENNIRPILKYLQTNGTDSVKQMSEKLWDIFFKPIEDSED